MYALWQGHKNSCHAAKSCKHARLTECSDSHSLSSSCANGASKVSLRALKVWNRGEQCMGVEMEKRAGLTGSEVEGLQHAAE